MTCTGWCDCSNAVNEILWRFVDEHKEDYKYCMTTTMRNHDNVCTPYHPITPGTCCSTMDNRTFAIMDHTYQRALPMQSTAVHTHLHTHICTHDRFTALCPDLPRCAGNRRNIHPLTPINHPYQLPPSTTNHSIIPAQSTYLAISLHNL